jgi:quercetin dioxygenase-like cupin family protein
MRIVRVNPESALPITNYESVAASGVPIADGAGEAHVYSIVFEPGGSIGPHEANFGQLFLPVRGSGWVAGEDGERLEVRPGEGGYITRGEVHSKGSQEGMTALMIQVHDLVPCPGVLDE